MISIPLAEMTETPRVIGRMEYDQVQMRWVKTRRPAGEGKAGDGGTWKSEGRSEEDDPFRDMESTRGSEGMRALDEDLEEQEQRGEENEDANRDESQAASQVSREEEEVTQGTASLRSFQFPSSRSNSPPPSGQEPSPPSPPAAIGTSDPSTNPKPSSPDPPSVKPSLPNPPPLAHHPHSAPPAPAHAGTPLPSSRQTPRIASGNGLRPYATPVSVLKKRSPALNAHQQTPCHASGGVAAGVDSPSGMTPHRRSVSFSDGRKQGKILDLRVSPTGEEEDKAEKRGLFDATIAGGEGEDDDTEERKGEYGKDVEKKGGKSTGSGEGSRERSIFLPSARTARIQNMLENLDLDGDGTNVSVDSACFCIFFLSRAFS
jgi:hypothetical protein